MEAKCWANVTPFYVDFEPPCDWRNDNRNEILVLFLPEFKKEQLKIQISNMKTLKISGERQVDEAKTSRFCKRITVPRNCNAKEIYAKFVDGLLQIKMPKKVSFSDQEQFSKDEGTGQSKSEISQDQANKFRNSGNVEETAAKKIEKPSNATNIVSTKDETRSPSRLKRFTKVAMTVTVAAGLGALIVYLCLLLLA